MREHALLSLFNNTLNVIIMKINGIQKNKSELKWKFFKISFICHTFLVNGGSMGKMRNIGNLLQAMKSDHKNFTQ